MMMVDQDKDKFTSKMKKIKSELNVGGSVDVCMVGANSNSRQPESVPPRLANFDIHHSIWKL